MALLQQPLMTALGWALVHFLWQGALIALLLAAADAALHKAGPRARYASACGAMMLMVLSAAGTFVWLRFAVLATPPPAVTGYAAFGSIDGAAAAAAAVPLQTKFAGWLPWLDCLWLAGVLGLSARSALGWNAAQKLKRADTSPTDTVWEQNLIRLARLLHVSAPVRLAKSALARTPGVVGWLKPVILVPAAAFTWMEPEQLEALLAHELAHIRRHDYLVNLIQSAAETLLFYHPAVWWVSRKIRIERENCCDDLAVSVCGDVLTYARALTRLEELRTGGPQFAMAADTGSLLARIRRILAAGPPHRRRPGTWLTGFLVVFALCAIWGIAEVSLTRQSRASEPPPQSARAAAAASEAEQQAAPAPARKPERASKPVAPASSGSFIQGLADAGYPNLTVDQLIAFKIHGVSAEYIRQLRAAGVDRLTPDQLVAFRIHGVEPGEIEELKSAGFGALSSDQIVAFRIHGITPEYARNIRDQKLGEVTPDKLVAMKIHNVTPEFVRSLKDAGLTKLTCDDAVAARIHNITPSFIEEARKHGFKDLTIDQLIRLKQSGVL
jgi:beta-lactamase regulating signal transducer with metallopeptidase domain